MSRRTHQTSGYVALLLPGLCVQLSGGCTGGDKTARWQQWEYDQSQAKTTAQQVEAQQSWQRDSSLLRAPYEAVPAEMPSNTMTERQRRAFQARLVEKMHDRAKRQASAADLERRAADRAREQAKASGAGR